MASLRHVAYLMGLAFLMVAGASAALAADCDRACLYGYVDQYLEALVAQDPGRLPLAEDVRFSENSVEMEIGDGLWNTISGRDDYDLRFADVREGQVGFYGVVREHGNPAILALRLKIEDDQISEVETILSRYEEGRPFPSAFPLNLKPKKILNDFVPEDRRVSRERMIELANGYFETLEQNDGSIHTEFAENCNRIENGVQTTNNPEMAERSKYFGMGCEEQFKLGLYRYDDRLRGRRFPLVDVERGLVLAGGFIDHSGTLLEFELTDGSMRTTNYKSPHSYCLFELFKIVDGKITQVEAVFFTVPYNMPSPWVE